MKNSTKASIIAAITASTMGHDALALPTQQAVGVSTTIVADNDPVRTAYTDRTVNRSTLQPGTELGVLTIMGSEYKSICFLDDTYSSVGERPPGTVYMTNGNTVIYAQLKDAERDIPTLSNIALYGDNNSPSCLKGDLNAARDLKLLFGSSPQSHAGRLTGVYNGTITLLASTE